MIGAMAPAFLDGGVNPPRVRLGRGDIKSPLRKTHIGDGSEIRDERPF